MERSRASMDSPGELSFVSEHDTDTDTDSSDTCAHRERRRKEKEEEEKKKKKKKKTMKKKSDGGVTVTPACVTTTKPTGSNGRKRPAIVDRPTAGQTNGAFEPDSED